MVHKPEQLHDISIHLEYCTWGGSSMAVQKLNLFEEWDIRLVVRQER